VLTLYTVVKGFTGSFAHIQRNAIRSWQTVVPDAEIVLFGDAESGALREAAALGVPVLPMHYNDHGAPLIADVIEVANEIAQHDIRCLLNGDVILEPSFRPAVCAVADEFDEFFFSVRRYNVNVPRELDFDGDWHGYVCGLKRKAYTLAGTDVFCYRGDWLTGMPAFGMGRTTWDNWVMARAKRARVPFVYGDEYTQSYHQNHPKRKPKAERRENVKLMEQEFDGARSGTLRKANYILNSKGAIEKASK
jgi:hypothetical protein